MTTAPPAPGSQQDLDARAAAIHSGFEHPKSAPIQTGVASLWTKAQNIHNPVLRVLGEIGAGGARALDAAGQAVGRVVPAVGAVESAIPGSTMNEEFKQRQENKQEARQAGIGKVEAETEEAKARAHELENPAAKQTQPEQEVLHDLMTGENGTPRINPDTQKPYTYLEAYQAANQAKQAPPQSKTDEGEVVRDLMTGDNGLPRVNPDTQKPYTHLEAFQAAKQAAQDTKPQPEAKTDHIVRIVNGVPHEILVDAKTGADIKDLGQTKIPDTGSKADARSDKSYTYNNDKLDKLGKPIEDAQARMGRLTDTLAQGTPQADALIAPELLTIMAGGAGSGLRMNEAEISRIVGGRSKWESLKAAANQWQLDPTKANTITPEQRKEIHSLVGAVNVKLQAKQQALDNARENLLNSDDPKEHRRIVTDAHHALTQVDTQAGGAEPERPANVPKEYVYQENGPKGKGWYKPKAAEAKATK
jgi:hypothetical protein